MNMRSILFTLLLLAGSTCLCHAQPVDLYPKIGRSPNTGEDAQKRFARLKELFKKENLSEKEQEEKDALVMEFDDSTDTIWDIIGNECSWYCGAEVYKVVASSELEPNGNIEYRAKNAHDLSFETAWVEGAKGYGEGEYLEYYFANECPRLHTVIIYNGYVKAERLWYENSRVKSLEMKVNGEPYAILHLKDTPAQQLFSVGLLGHREDGEDLILRFTIKEVYPGCRYEDTAITQIYFDGTDVHCLAQGTEVLMADMSLKRIEDIKPGDEVASYDRLAAKLDKSVVGRVCSPIHNEMVEYVFESGQSIVATAEHPFLVDGKGWSSSAPVKTDRYKGMVNTKKIETGDRFVVVGEDHEIHLGVLKEVIVINDSIRTYTIAKLSKGDNFIANGMVVGVEDL